MHFDLHCLAVVTLILISLSAGIKANALPDEIIRNMDPEANPCQDFYEYACGNWSAVHAKDPYSSLVGQLDYGYEERLASLLESKNQSSGKEARFLQLPRDFYSSCRRDLDMPQVLDFLQQLATRPELGNNELTVALIAAFRLKNLVQMENMEDIWLQLLVRTSTEWNSNETNTEPIKRQHFEVLVQESLSREIFWREISELERNMMQDDEGPEDPSTAYYEESLRKGHTPAFWMLPWRRSPPSLRYIQHMAALLTERSPRFLIYYILLRLKLAAGTKEGLRSALAWQVSRSECAKQSRQLLSHPSVWLLEKDQPRLREEPVLQGIFQTLKHRFGQKLRANRNDFKRKSLKILLSKLKHMTLRLSVLPRQKSNHSLERRIERYYHDLHLNAADYFGNLLAALQHSTEQKEKFFSSLHPLFPLLNKVKTNRRGQPLPVEVHGFGSYASPFYIRRINTLVVPLSLLEPPLYTPGQSDLLTYSSLGIILGHELTHGFSPETMAMDSHGRQRLSLALELLRNRRFQEQTDCLRFRFGAEQMEEKFSDANGLELAYSAFFDRADGDSRWNENSIEMVSTSQRQQQQQQFFVNFAQFFCSDENFLEDSDDHGSDRSRTNDAVANFEPFQEAFQCPKKHRREKKYGKRTQCRLY